MLDIIITHYKEQFYLGKPLLDIIGLQRGIDFDAIKVIIVNDGEEYHIPDEKLGGYPYHVEQVDIKHGGVSAARNAGMDHSVAEWIMFCDFDDTFSNIYALRDILNILPADDYDLLSTKLLKEDFQIEHDCLMLAPEVTNYVFVHGKIYRRQWLIDNGIRFDEELNYQEDSLFNAYIVALLDYRKVGRIDAPFPPYVWCRRTDSVTTVEGHSDPANYCHFRRNVKLCEFYKKHLPKKRLRDLVVRTAFDTYYMCNGVHITDGMKVRIIREYQDFMREYDKYYAKPDSEILEGIEQISWQELEEAPLIYKVDYDIVTAWKNILIGGLVLWQHTQVT